MKSLPLLCFLFLTVPLAAENAAVLPPSPAGKIPNSAPDFCRWEISVQYAPPQKSPGTAAPSHPQVNKTTPEEPRVAKITVVKTGKVVSQIIESVSGQRCESWLVEELHLQRSSEHPGLILREKGDEQNRLEPIQNGKFEEFSWLGPDNFKGELQLQGRKVLLFQKEGVPHPAADKVALIDANSHFPVMLQTGEERRLYEVTPLPATVQSLPGEVSSTLEKYHESIRRLTAPSGRPF